jgi:hypothetical protein
MFDHGKKVMNINLASHSQDARWIVEKIHTVQYGKDEMSGKRCFQA